MWHVSSRSGVAYTAMRCSLMPNSHRQPDTTKTVLSVSVWRGAVNWTIALNVFRLQIFCRRQSRAVCGNPVHNGEYVNRIVGRDTDKTVLSCLARRCELTLIYTCTVIVT